ncbi:LLM class flavin-dependent oxidoreductase [Acidicapsa acidisoli]|uniref:LLM class flavin-dependent oxidoreductase n=1 Tax=Acidicapsa acidisoli TaxID=1615681 RepID=UPI0021E0C88B|nr:LLM class flavin-dependent oxidoreductase [Acidicapsa acidisoli]
MDGAYFHVHHFARQLASPFPPLAAVGAKTRKIEIATAVIDMRYENPHYMAEDAGVADLIAVGRLQLGISRGLPEQVINEVVGEMAGMMRGEARGHGVSIRTDLKDDLPMTVADLVQLQQVLMNLMLNGIEAMKDTGGVLTVKSQLGEDGRIEIAVKDTGPGLPVGNADQIFDAFFTTKPQGSGIGLAISKSIVESHGGRIWAHGNGGRGATFHLHCRRLPRNEPSRGCRVIRHSAE